MNKVKKIERYMDIQFRGMTVEQGEEIIEIFNKLIQHVFANTLKRFVPAETY